VSLWFLPYLSIAVLDLRRELAGGLGISVRGMPRRAHPVEHGEHRRVKAAVLPVPGPARYRERPPGENVRDRLFLIGVGGGITSRRDGGENLSDKPAWKRHKASIKDARSRAGIQFDGSARSGGRIFHSSVAPKHRTKG